MMHPDEPGQTVERRGGEWGVNLSPYGLFLMVPLFAAPFPLLRGSETLPSDAQFELAACLLGLLCGAMLINRVDQRSRRHFAMLGCAYLIAASESIVSTVAMLAGLDGGEPVAGWLRPGAVLSRGILPALIFAMAPTVRARAVERDPHGHELFDGRLVYAVMVLAAALTALTAMVPFPDTLPPGWRIAHPVDLVAGAIYAGALVMLAIDFQQTREPGVWWVALACGVSAVSHLFIGFSLTSHDAMWELAEGYQLLAPALPMLGLAVKAPGRT